MNNLVRVIADHLATLEAQPCSLGHLQEEYVRLVLVHAKQNRTRAAKLLGIDRRTLYRWLKRLKP